MSKKPSVTMQIVVTLSPASAEYLDKNARDGDVAGTLVGWVNYFLDNQTRGGMLLSPEDHDYLSSLNDGKRFKDSRSLCRAVEKGLKREEGQFCFQITIDPTYVPVLREYAEQSGMTLEELVQNGFAMVCASNWLYDLTPSGGRMIPFTREQLQQVADAVGKPVGNVDSTDVFAVINSGGRADEPNPVAA